MKVNELHGWNVSRQEAEEIQRKLRNEISLEDHIAISDIKLVAGIDNGYTTEDGITTAHAVVVVLDFPGLNIVEKQFASERIDFPYIPGLLSFREAPAILAACRKVANEPDVVLFDAQGYAHFRRLGVASHIGLILDVPSIGCAKTRLIGRYEEPKEEFGAYAPLVDHNEVIGAVVRTRLQHSPLFVSPGHRISVETAMRVVLACCKDNNFLPEPTRLAHNLITEYTRPLRRSTTTKKAKSRNAP
jgi:deoxyribonuclease V